MPLGSKHDETGLLLTARGALILRCDDGGRWRLDADLGSSTCSDNASG